MNSSNFADIARFITKNPSEEDENGSGLPHKTMFKAVEKSLLQASVLALPDSVRPFSDAFGASDYAIGCELMHDDPDGHDRALPMKLVS